MQLPVADIDCVNPCGAALDQHLSEAAGRSTDIETDAVARIKTEAIQCCCELHAAARDIWMWGPCADFCININLLGGFANEDAVREHEAGVDCILSFRTAF